MTKIVSILDSGNSSILINVECHLSNSLPNIVIVGFANKSVDEAKERIRSAFASSGIKLPKKRITINLSPADIPKEGSSFDLPIFVSILNNAELIKLNEDMSKVILLGELGLTGEIKPVRGIIGKIIAGKRLGIRKFWIPYDNLKQASLIPDVELYPVKNIKELYQNLISESGFNYSKTVNNPELTLTNDKPGVNIHHVIGQEKAKRALIIAAAGHHNIMLNGPPGTGKSMLAKSILGIMPAMNQEEILEVTHIHSLGNKNFEKIITNRPFRAPHHTSSTVSIIGGGQNPKPGEISLSHHGVLMFDEFPEYGRSVIESLRQPLEEKVITVSRAKETLDFPANFLFIATSNPCPCGYFGSKKECTCLPTQIQKYQRKISGPILDRIDLYVDVEEVDNKLLLEKVDYNDTSNLRNLVQNARSAQYLRNNKLNSLLKNDDIIKKAKISDAARDIINIAGEKLKLSPRSYLRTLRVARTIADLDSSEYVEAEHVTEALQYRKRAVEI